MDRSRPVRPPRRHHGGQHPTNTPYSRHHSHHPTHRHSGVSRPSSISEHCQKSDYLLTKDDFLRLARPTDSDTDRAYEEYVKEHQRAFLIKFAAVHGGDPWLGGLYPEGDVSLEQEEGIMVRVERYEGFVGAHNVSLDFGRGEWARPDGKMVVVDMSVAPDGLRVLMDTVTRDTPKRQLYINNIPPAAPPSELLGQIRGLVGDTAESLRLSNPVPSKGFLRSAWLSLRSDERDLDLETSPAEARLLDGLKVRGNILSFYPRDLARKIKLVSGGFADPERVRVDLRISKELITSLNVDKRIAFDLDTFSAVSDELERLDRQLLFLRVVHRVCYYSAYEAACPEELARHCGEVCLRDVDARDRFEQEFAIFDKKIQLLIDRGYRTLGLKPVKLEERLELQYCRKEEEGRYRCSECNKPFKGPEFVVKHLMLKHEDLLASVEKDLVLVNKILDLPHFLLLPATMTVRPKISGHGGYNPARRTSRDYGYRPGPGSAHSSRPGPYNSQHHHSHGQQHRQEQRPPPRHYVDLDAPPSASVDISYDL